MIPELQQELDKLTELRAKLKTSLETLHNKQQLFNTENKDLLTSITELENSITTTTTKLKTIAQCTYDEIKTYLNLGG